ncbi:MAG: hypothetical protein PVS3B3_29500 [Ktedonobacteraceae bacterium]
MTETTESSFDKARRKLVAARIELMGQLAKFSQDELTQSPIEGEWSALQIAHHTYITEGLVLEQMKRVQREDNPLIADVSADSPQQQLELTEAPASLEAILTGLAARREELFESLSTLSEDAWNRPFQHAKWGNRKFYQLVNVLPIHDQQHTQQLAKMKDEL